MRVVPLTYMPENSMMNHPTVNQIFMQNGAAYREKHPQMSYFEKKVMRSIEICRTEELGGRVEVCDRCGHTINLYNSCRNRHCPQCQNIKKEKWILDRKKEVLPFTYFHIVFTLPDALNQIVFKNKRLVFNLMFHACSETLLSVSADEKYFGVNIGFFAILHTWGQKLNLHPHLHCVVPGGGYSHSKAQWINAANGFLLPVQVLKMRFRGLFLKGIKSMRAAGVLCLAGTQYENPIVFQKLIDSLFSTDWVVYLKESFQTSESVIEYLARYTHKIAISNQRIISADNGTVSFIYRDYKDKNKEKITSMDVYSFMRRFMLHVVPYRFVRIRYYGILSHRNKRKAISECRDFYNIEKQSDLRSPDWRDVFLIKTGRDCSICPVCKTGRLIMKELIPILRYRAPPDSLSFVTTLILY